MTPHADALHCQPTMMKSARRHYFREKDNMATFQRVALRRRRPGRRRYHYLVLLSRTRAPCYDVVDDAITILYGIEITPCHFYSCSHALIDVPPCSRLLSIDALPYEPRLRAIASTHFAMMSTMLPLSAAISIIFDASYRRAYFNIASRTARPILVTSPRVILHGFANATIHVIANAPAHAS